MQYLADAPGLSWGRCLIIGLPLSVDWGSGHVSSSTVVMLYLVGEGPEEATQDSSATMAPISLHVFRDVICLLWTSVYLSVKWVDNPFHTHL